MALAFKSFHPLSRALKNTKLLFCLGSIAFIVYIALANLFLLPAAVWSPDEGAKLLQLKNLRWQNHALNIEILYPGTELDPELKFALSDPKLDLLQVVDGKLIFQRLPIFPLLEKPLFKLAGYPGLYLLPALCGALIGVIALLMILPDHRRALMWITIAFGSPVLIYSVIFWEHTLAALSGLSAAWLAIRLSEAEHLSSIRMFFGWLLVGMLLCLGIFLRLEMLIFSAALITACLVYSKRRRWGPIVAACVVGLTWLLYQPAHELIMSGQSLPRNAQYLNYPLAYLRHAGWRSVVDILIGPFEDLAINPGWPGVLWTCASILAILTSLRWFRKPIWRVVHLAALSLSAVIALYFLITPDAYHSAHGLLFTTPWALLGVTRAREMWDTAGRRGKIIVVTALLGLTGYIVAMVGFRASSPHGGLEWGARLALVYYPLLALIAAWDINKKHGIEKAIILAMIFLGIGFQVRGLLTIRQDKLVNNSINQEILQAPEYYTISNMWWLALNTAPIYPAKAVQLATSPQEIASWVELADQQGIKHFALLVQDPAILDQVAAQLPGLCLSIQGQDSFEGYIHYQLAVGCP